MAEENVCSEITGTVWKIELEIGATVAEDDVIMILESMKMEIPVLAPCAGTLKKLQVEEGAAIAEGQVIAILDT
jgi:acetyl-CoA carboxylase biotin carboxyl carrier protein